MAKKLLTALIVAIAIFLMDWLIHGVILMGFYENPEIWKLDSFSTHWWAEVIIYLVYGFAFVFAYAQLVSPKNMKKAFLFGFFWGLAAGMSMGYGSYINMHNIPYALAAGWFWFTWAEMIIAGIIMGLFIKDSPAPATE